MTNLLNYISLKRNCTNRFVRSPLPSEGMVLEKEFLLPDFPDKFFELQHQSNQPKDSPQSLLDQIIQEIEGTFQDIKEDIEKIQATLVSKARNIFGTERDLIEKDRLKYELRELHQKVLETKMKPDVLEEFAAMFNHCKEKINCAWKPICKNTIETFRNFVRDIQADINKSLQEVGTKAMKELVFIPQVLPEKETLKTKPYKVQELFYPTGRDIQGCWLELEGKTSLLCFGYRNKLGGEPIQARLYAIEKGKLCSSIPNCNRLPHAFSKRLNCLAFCYSRYTNENKELIIDLHRINSKGVQKISEIHLPLLQNQPITFGESPLLNHCHLIKSTDIRLSFVNSHGLILVKQAHKILVMNVITKRLLCEKEFPEGILDISDWKDLGSVVVLTTKRALIFKIEDRNYSLVQYYSLKTAEDNSCAFSSGRIFIEGNIILISLNQTYKTEPYSSCYVLQLEGSKIKHSTFLVLSPLNYVPVIQPAEGKITLFGVLSWLGFYLKKNFIYYIKEDRLEEERGSENPQDQKEIIYADSFRTIAQKKLECGGKKIIYGASEHIVQNRE